MDATTIRPPRQENVAEIAKIVTATGMFPAEMLDEMMAPFFRGEADELWFVIGRPVVGVAYAVPERLTNGTWNQLLVAVDPASQGTGIGKRLMRNLEGVAAQRGGRVVIAETSGTEAFEPTRAFYRGIGYTEEARIRDFWDQGDDKIIFRRALV